MVCGQRAHGCHDYMMEWSWQVNHLHRWTRPSGPYLIENEMSIQDPWWKLERALLVGSKAQRTARLASKEHHQHLVAGIDWHIYRQLIRAIPGERKPHLRTWIQGAIRVKEDGKAKLCPVCKVPATTKHIIWLCKWHQTQQRKPMPPEWAERILSDDETPLWAAGWIPLEPQENRQIQRPYQGHGAWRELQPLAPHQYQGWAFTLDATPSSYDPTLGIRPLRTQPIRGTTAQARGHHRNSQPAPHERTRTYGGLGGFGQTHNYGCACHRPAGQCVGGMDSAQISRAFLGPARTSD